MRSGLIWAAMLVTAVFAVADAARAETAGEAFDAGKTCLAKALTQTGLRNPEEWGTEEERTLIDAYLNIRVTYGRSPMTDAEKRARVTKKYLTDGIISDRRGSFKRSSSTGSTG